MDRPLRTRPPSSQSSGQGSGSTPMSAIETKPNGDREGTSSFVDGSSLPLQVSTPPDSLHGDSVVPSSTTSVSDPGTNCAFAGTTSLTSKTSSEPVFVTWIW